MSEGTRKLVLAGLLVFAMAGFLWPLAAGIYMEEMDRRRRGEPPEYDERQALARLRAGVHALYALLGYLAVWAALDLAGWFAWTGDIPMMVLFGGVWTLMVWTADCILHDAWTGWSQRKQSFQGTAFLIGGINFIFPASTQIRTGNTAWGVAMAFLGAGFLVLAGISAYAASRQRPAEGDE